jgi:murein DD-endopeptidase MepM/ murein hydrolase activator NlpD
MILGLVTWGWFHNSNSALSIPAWVAFAAPQNVHIQPVAQSASVPLEQTTPLTSTAESDTATGATSLPSITQLNNGANEPSTVITPTIALLPEPTVIITSTAQEPAPLLPTTITTPTTLAEPTAKVALILAPTVTPTPTEEPTVEIVSTLPQVRIIPAAGIKLPPTRTPTPPVFAVPTATRTPTPLPILPGRLWSNFVPAPAAESDHFWVGRPFLPSAPNQVASPSYQFGSTAGNRYRPHHGMDMSNPFGVPVLAATEGEVIHAGPDDVALLGPYNNFYGNTVVIRLARRLTVGDSQLDVYLLYGHLSQVFVAAGQQVQPADVVGAVGMTGIAIGPHLHMEMRLGANTYRHSVNPYLWVQPMGDQGAVAVRLLTADGRTWPGARLTLARFESGKATWARLIETYLDTENIGPDPAWGENGAMDGVPPGYYVLVGVVNGESIRSELTVNPGETTFVEIRTRQ